MVPRDSPVARATAGTYAGGWRIIKTLGTRIAKLDPPQGFAALPAAEQEAWLAPFLAAMGRKTRRTWAPLYLRGLLGPGERKSLQPMAARVAPADYDQLHHFVAVGPWDEAPLQVELLAQANQLPQNVLKLLG